MNLHSQAGALEANKDVHPRLGSVAEALRFLEQECPDMAVLDMNLRGEMVTPVARLLRQMGVPFVVASAHNRASVSENEVLVGAQYLGKPTRPATLCTNLRGGDTTPL